MPVHTHPPAPVVDDATRREFLALLGAAGLLTGCGTGTTTDRVGAPGYPRTVDHAGGTATIPAPPQRVACLSPLGELEAVLALGVAPVQVGIRSFTAQFTGDPLGLWPWQQAVLDRLGATPERVSADNPADAEVLARAAPDLIVGGRYFVEEARARLEELAPVLVTGADWRANLRSVAAAIDRAADAEQLITDTDTRIAAALEGLDVTGARIAIVYPQTGLIASSAHPAAPIVDLFTRAGLAPLDELAAQASADVPAVQLSSELTGTLAPADLLVVTAYSPPDWAALQTNPLWTALPAVRAGRVHVIEQGPVAQAIATLSPLNLDVVLPDVRTAATLLG